MTYANDVDPDQNVPEEAVWSGSTLFAIPLRTLRNNCIKKQNLGQKEKRNGIKCSKFKDTCLIVCSILTQPRWNDHFKLPTNSGIFTVLLKAERTNKEQSNEMGMTNENKEQFLLFFTIFSVYL